MFLSAALIVKNEAWHLPDCLRSIESLVDEIVVVDTGSTDATVAIAKASPKVRLFEFAWCEDFSAARNVSLSHCRGSWILYIDADERARPYCPTVLRRELEQDGVVAAQVRFHAISGFTPYPELRLFLNDPEIRFEGRMHEGITPACGRVAEQRAGRFVQTGLVLDHIGYDGDQSHKLARNLPLLINQVGDSPERVYLRWHLGRTLYDLGRVAEALEQWRLGADMAKQAPRQTNEDASCLIELAQHAVATGRNPSPWIQEGLGLQPGNWLLISMSGRTLALEGRYDEARPAFDALAEVDAERLIGPVGFDKRLFGPHALAQLAQIALERGDYAVCAQALENAVSRDPTRLEYRAKLAFARSRLGRPEGLL